MTSYSDEAWSYWDELAPYSFLYFILHENISLICISYSCNFSTPNEQWKTHEPIETKTHLFSFLCSNIESIESIFSIPYIRNKGTTEDSLLILYFHFIILVREIEISTFLVHLWLWLSIILRHSSFRIVSSCISGLYWMMWYWNV